MAHTSNRPMSVQLTGFGVGRDKSTCCRREWNREDELPVYLAGPTPTGQHHRKSYGMFSSVEGAFESKTIDFDNYAVGRRGSRTPRSGSRERLLDTGDETTGKTPGSNQAQEGSVGNSPGERDDSHAGVEVRHPSGKETPDGKQEGGVRELESTPSLSVL
ncbi:unnamed protein product [Pleuronectes platessa]|uniref:Uncharacterized protein n=1 Tax=Pleuronectes platessa TaxID=8262 RepID=A0A9N7YEI8_PLEPL|nr:unnamed protein product [Pleuronectes platessa]